MKTLKEALLTLGLAILATSAGILVYATLFVATVSSIVFLENLLG